MKLSETRYVFWDGAINVDEQGRVNREVTCKQYYLEEQAIKSNPVDVAPKSRITLRQGRERMETATVVSIKEDRTALSNLVIPTIKVRIEKVDEWFVPVTDLMAIQLKLRFVQNINCMLLRIRECKKGEVGRVIYQEHFKKEQIEKLPTTDKSLNEPEANKENRKAQRKSLKAENKIASCLTHCTVEVWISSFALEFDNWNGVTEGKEFFFNDNVERACSYCLHDRSVPKDEPWSLYSPLREAKWSIKQYDQMAEKWKQRTEHKRNKHASRLGKNQTLIGCELIEDIMNNETNIKVYDQEPNDRIWADKWFGNRKMGDRQVLSAFPALLRRTLYQICTYSPIGMALLEAVAKDPNKKEVHLFPTKVIYPHIGGSGVNPAKQFTDDYDYEKRVHELTRKIKTKDKEDDPDALEKDADDLLNDETEDVKEIRSDSEIAAFLKIIKTHAQAMREYAKQLKKYEEEQKRKHEQQQAATLEKKASAPASDDVSGAPLPPPPPNVNMPGAPMPPPAMKMPPIMPKGKIGGPIPPPDQDAPPEKPQLPRTPYDDRVTFLVKRAVLRRIGASAAGVGSQSRFYLNLDYLKQNFEDSEYACRYHRDGTVLPFTYAEAEYQAVEARMGLKKEPKPEQKKDPIDLKQEAEKVEPKKEEKEVFREVHIETPFFLAFLHEMVHARRFQLGLNAEYDIFPRTSPADSTAVPWHPDSFLQAIVRASIDTGGATTAKTINRDALLKEMYQSEEPLKKETLFPSKARENLKNVGLDQLILGARSGSAKTAASGPSVAKAYYVDMNPMDQYLLKTLPCSSDEEKERFRTVATQMYEQYTGAKAAAKIPDVIPNLVSRYTDENGVHNREEYDTIEGAGVVVELSEVVAKHAAAKGISLLDGKKVRLTENLFRQELGLPLRRRYTDGKTNLTQEMSEEEARQAEARLYIKPGTRATRPEKLETPDISRKYLESAEKITNELLLELGIKDKQAVLMERDKNFFLTDSDHFALAYQASSLIKQPNAEDSKNWCAGESVNAKGEKLKAFLVEMVEGRDSFQSNPGAAAAPLLAVINSTEEDYYLKTINILKELFAMNPSAIATIRQQSGKLQSSWEKASGYDAFAGFLMDANIESQTGRTVDPSLALKGKRAAYLPEKFRDVEDRKILHTLIHEPIHLMSYWCAGFDQWNMDVSSTAGVCYDVIVRGLSNDATRLEALHQAQKNTQGLPITINVKCWVSEFFSQQHAAAIRDVTDKKPNAQQRLDDLCAASKESPRVAFQMVTKEEGEKLCAHLAKVNGASEVSVVLHPKNFGSFFINQLFNVKDKDAIRSVLNEGTTELFTRIISWRLNERLNEEAVRITTVCGFGSYEYPMHLVSQIVRDLNEAGYDGLSLLASAYFSGNWIALNDAFEKMREAGKFHGRYTPPFWGAVENLGISNDHQIGLEKNKQAILDLRDRFGLPWRLPNELVDELNHDHYHDPVCCRYIYTGTSYSYEHQPLDKKLKASCCIKYGNPPATVPLHPQPLPFKCPLCEDKIVIPGEQILKNGKPRSRPATEAPKPRTDDTETPPASAQKAAAASPPPKQGAVQPKEVIGINNAGNSCYLNASLQLLFHSRFVADPNSVSLPVLKTFFQAYDANRNEGIEVAQASVQPIRVILFQEKKVTSLNDEDDPALALEYLLEHCGYECRLEVDRVYVLDKRTPEKEKPKTGKFGDTELDKTGKQHRIESVRLVRVEPDNQGSLQEAWLKSWDRGKSSLDPLPRANVNDELYLNLEGVAERTRWSGVAPARVIVQLKRFTYRDGHFAAKITEAVQVENKITIDGAGYQLCGIINHWGDTPNRGHYTACIKGKTTRRWFRANDANIQEVQEPEVLAEATTAYLFYFEKLEAN